MTQETTTRAGIAALVYAMTNSVLFGVGVTLVLSVPALSARAMLWIPVVVVASLVLAVPIAWWLAPRMRARYWRRRAEEDARLRHG